MVLHSLNGAYSDGGSQVLWQDGERVIRHDGGGRTMTAAGAPS